MRHHWPMHKRRSRRRSPSLSPRKMTCNAYCRFPAIATALLSLHRLPSHCTLNSTFFSLPRALGCFVAELQSFNLIFRSRFLARSRVFPAAAMAELAGGDSTASSGGENNVDATHGFTRPEMHKKPLVGSVDLYERHVFLCHKEATSWPSKVEAADYDPLPSKFVHALRHKKNEMPKKTRLTVAEGHDEPEKTNGDILIFPDMIKYKGLAESDVESFVDEVLVAGDMWALGSPEPLVGSHVFICGHGSRDKRCGVCGPPLKERFIQEIANRGLEDHVSVRFCSHIGGHKFAGNVIVFSHGEDGAVMGHWYGYVTPDDVTEILEQHIGAGKVIDRLWRGQMGLTEDQQKEIQETRLKEAGGAPETKADAPASNEIKDQAQANGTAENNESGPHTGKSHKLLPRIGSRDLHQMCGDTEEEAPLRPCPEKKTGLGQYFKLPRWMEEWEADDTKALFAVAGAATCVVVAYHLYRSSVQQQ